MLYMGLQKSDDDDDDDVDVENEKYDEKDDVEEDDDDEKHLKELEAVTGRRSPHRCSAFHSAVLVCLCIYTVL